jgi:hypothetical protein
MPVPPKPPSKRRNRGRPKSWGAAQPLKVGRAAPQPPDLGIKAAHPLIQALWDKLGESADSRFYSAADWQRVRLELAYDNRLLRARNRPPASSWQVFQRGLNSMLISPAEKHRCAIELEPADRDADEDAAVLQIVKYRESLDK